MSAMPRSPTDPALVVQLRPMPRIAEPSDVAAGVDGDAQARTDQLVARARRGDLDAWSRLYQDTFDALLKHVCYLTGDSALAEDLVQDAYARAMANVRQYDGRSSFMGWLRGIALNVVRMHWRRSRSGDRANDRLRVLAEVCEGGLTAGVDVVHMQDQRMKLLYELLATLPENLREAFVLRELEGMPPAEAASLIGITEGNLAVRASRARAKLREELERLGWSGGAS